jgi:hypothetical protein
MNKLDRKHKLQLITLGRFFGYPECCIKEFVETFGLPKLKRKLNGTGYIPCFNCNKKSESILIYNIQQKRSEPKGFPNNSK